MKEAPLLGAELIFTTVVMIKLTSKHTRCGRDIKDGQLKGNFYNSFFENENREYYFGT